MKRSTFSLVALATLITLVLGACCPPAETPEPTMEEKMDEPMGPSGEVTLWHAY